MKLIVNGEVAQIPTGGVGAVSYIPTGGIIMWSGTDVPDGWALCNGENGTPDLRGRFVLGASDTHTMGSTGGSEEVTLTVRQLPPHIHDLEKVSSLSGSNFGIRTGNNLGTIQYIETGSAGNGEPHPNMPPYYTLAYIMKL